MSLNIPTGRTKCHMTLATGRSVSRCFSLFLVPEGGTEAGRSLGERRDRRLVHSLLTGTGAVTADALHPLVEVAQRAQPHRSRKGFSRGT